MQTLSATELQEIIKSSIAASAAAVNQQVKEELDKLTLTAVAQLKAIVSPDPKEPEAP